MSKFNYFFLNGQKYVTDYKLTLLELIEYFNYNTSLLVLEYNSLICKEKNWNKILLKRMIKLKL
jgi:sulfur carrier protein ThiS